MADVRTLKHTAGLLLVLGFSLPLQSESKTSMEPWEINEGASPTLVQGSMKGPGESPFYDGDILLTEKQASLAFGNSTPECPGRGCAGLVPLYWPDATIPYIIDSSLTNVSMAVLQEAMVHIESRSCIRFRERQATDQDYVHIVREAGCWSYVGRKGGEQTLSIGDGCQSTGIVQHEMGHALGFFHEQSRADRDRYIDVRMENVRRGAETNFNKQAITPTFGYAYDYASVMHYCETAFSRNGSPTMQVKGKGLALGFTIGKRKGLSKLDIGRLREIYGCNKEYIVCPDGWVWEDKACYKFVAKDHLSFKDAWLYCEKQSATLLHIESQSENDYIEQQIKSTYPQTTTWRTGGYKTSKEFVWYTGPGNRPKPMRFTSWKDGEPSTGSSMVLVFTNMDGPMQWESVSEKTRFPFICERKANRQTCTELEFSDGRDYRGPLDYTESGITCQNWSEQYPHRHTFTDDVTEHRYGLGDHNYCRNPVHVHDGRRRQPWCFTGKAAVEWQYCDVTAC